MHFLGDDMKLEPTSYMFNDLFKTDVPKDWHLSAVSKQGHEIELDLKLTATLSYHGAVDEEPVTEYILKAEGKINGRPVKGKGTMELISRLT